MWSGDRNGPSTRKASNLFDSIAIKNLHTNSAENGGMQSKDCADFIAFSNSASAKVENYHSLNDNKRLPSISFVAIHVIAWTLHKHSRTFSPSSRAANSDHRRRTRNDNIFHWNFNFIVRQKLVIKIVINFLPVCIQIGALNVCATFYLSSSRTLLACVVSHSSACSLYGLQLWLIIWQMRIVWSETLAWLCFHDCQLYQFDVYCVPCAFAVWICVFSFDAT